MSNAWETTIDDVENVLVSMGINGVSEEKLEEITDFKIDHVAIEKAALYGESMEKQTDYAYEEIEKQLNLFGGVRELING